jgi:hypothetical protein
MTSRIVTPDEHTRQQPHTAYWDETDRCWYVPVSPEMHRQFVSLEPCRLELKDGQFHITMLDDVE